MYKLSERESYSHRKETKATMVEEIKHITTKNKNKNELRILAAVLRSVYIQRMIMILIVINI